MDENFLVVDIGNYKFIEENQISLSKVDEILNFEKRTKLEDDILKTGVVTEFQYRQAAFAINHDRELHQKGRSTLMGSTGKKILNEWIVETLQIEKQTTTAQIEKVAKVIVKEHTGRDDIRLPAGYGANHVARSPNLKLIGVHVDYMNTNQFQIRRSSNMVCAISC
ncbi:MAG: hypothetical protein EZS28_048021, partial [Streblomastix strix]